MKQNQDDSDGSSIPDADAKRCFMAVRTSEDSEINVFRRALQILQLEAIFTRHSGEFPSLGITKTE